MLISNPSGAELKQPNTITINTVVYWHCGVRGDLKKVNFSLNWMLLATLMDNSCYCEDMLKKLNSKIVWFDCLI